MRSQPVSVLVTLGLAGLLAVPACGGGGGNPPDANPGVKGDGGPDGGGMMMPDSSNVMMPDGMIGNGDGGMMGDGGMTADAGPPVMSISSIKPAAVSRNVDTDVTVFGHFIQSGATFQITNCTSGTQYSFSPTTVTSNGLSITATIPADPTREQGRYTVKITNPNMQSDTLKCALQVLAASPPTVTDVVPDTAYNGADQKINISGTGFESTPSVRFTKTDNSVSYDAIQVGFNSSTSLTAEVPSATRSMETGDYYVSVVNPDNLEATWLKPDNTKGVFTVTSTPPPDITDIKPVRVLQGTCTSTDITLTGTGFDPNAQAYIVIDPGVTTCNQPTITDQSGRTLCPMTVQAGTTSTSMVVDIDTTCPALGPHPLAVINPDGQSAYYFSLEITNSSSGHLNQGSFTPMPSHLNTARWKEGATFGFDDFGNAYMYVVGGQDASGAVLGSVEVSQFDDFGNPGPFSFDQQYSDAQNPRVANDLTVPRQGLTLVRVGQELFAIGGATQATDVASTVAASAKVEKARILGYDEEPVASLPKVSAPGGLPTGSWYYKVSAIGPWGESLGSNEVVGLNEGGQLQLCWLSPATSGATSYNIYRSLASDGRSGSEVLLKTEVPDSGSAQTCFTDTGTGDLAPAPGKLGGTLSAGTDLAAGTYSYRVSATVSTAGGPFETQAGYQVDVQVTAADITANKGDVTLSWDPVPISGVTYNVYKLDPSSGDFQLIQGASGLTATSFTDSGQALDASRNPRQGIVPLPPGSLSLWQSAPDLNTPREGLDGVAVQMDPGTPPNLAGRIIVAGGRTDNSGGAGTYLKDAESLGVNADGSTDTAWQFEKDASGKKILFTDPRVYYALVTTQGENKTPFPPPPKPPPCQDLDGDGYVTCSCPDAPMVCDCNDSDPTIHPGAPDQCGDGIDQNCDGVDPPCSCSTDADGDGHISIACGGDDCCDSGSDTSLGCTDATAGEIYPGAPDPCGDGIDQNCDGYDPVCFTGRGALTQTSSGSGLVCPLRDPPPTLAEQSSVYSTQGTSASYSPLNVVGSDPVYLVATLGDQVLTDRTKDTGSDNFEACGVDKSLGHLACSTWAIQVSGTKTITTSQSTFGHDAVLYFSFLFPFYAVSNENFNTSPPTINLVQSSISRFPVASPLPTSGNQILGTFQSASTTFVVPRAYYQMMRLLSYVYVVGGYTNGYTDPITGNAVPAGPTDLIERHQQ